KFGREPFRRSRSISTVRSSKPSRSRRCVAGEDGCLEPQIDQAMSVCGTCLYSGCCPRAAKRPGCSSAAEPRDECATVHSITSSVVARSDGGTTMLSAFTFSTRATLGGARPGSLARKGRQYGSPVTVPALLSALAASRPGLPISMPWRQRRSICVRSAPLRQGRNSALERADCPICGTQPLHHHVQCEPEQRLADRWILQSNLAGGVQSKHIE